MISLFSEPALFSLAEPLGRFLYLVRNVAKNCSTG